MEELDPAILTPGIRKTVLWLREHGFDTTDSGDGVTNVEAGMEDALDIPHVHMVISTRRMVSAARDLYDLLLSRKIAVDHGTIQSTYDPVSGVATLSLYGVDDSML